MSTVKFIPVDEATMNSLIDETMKVAESPYMIQRESGERTLAFFLEELKRVGREDIYHEAVRRNLWKKLGVDPSAKGLTNEVAFSDWAPLSNESLVATIRRIARHERAQDVRVTTMLKAAADAIELLGHFTADLLEDDCGTMAQLRTRAKAILNMLKMTR